MPFIKLVQFGFDDYTGEIGGIEFKDGVSTYPVSRRDADRLGACFSVEDAETGEQCNAANTIDTRLRGENAVDADGVKAQQTLKVEKPEVEVQAETEVQAEVQNEPVRKYTEAELGAIADEQGIAGLREIADGYGVKARNIKQIITGILKAQKD